MNYVQDPNEVIDYRGPDFHEPTPNMLAYLKEVICSKFKSRALLSVISFLPENSVHSFKYEFGFSVEVKLVLF